MGRLNDRGLMAFNEFKQLIGIKQKYQTAKGFGIE
jgi:hypothetical protein